MNAFLTIALLTFFVVLHELGHYISAKRSKIAVSEFFVGFGPKIFSFKKNKTEYGLKAFLLGGYVKIPGMDQNENPDGYENNELFHSATWTKKLYIASSGIIVNFLLAWIILFSIFAFYGIEQPTLEISTVGTSSVDQDEPCTF
jgi:RIP metalloprotease RseP